MSTEIIAFIIIGAVIIVIIYFLVKQTFRQLTSDFQSKATNDLLQIANEKLTSQQKQYNQELEHKKDLIKEMIDRIETDLNRYKQDLQRAEKERVAGLSKLVANLKDQQEIINKLEDSTTQLSTLLSDKQLRGNWGERTVENIMKYVGFVKGIDYTVQETLSESKNRPDFVINLSNGKKICIDVKFPLDNLKVFLESEQKEQKELALKRFKTDVKQKVKDVVARDYISKLDNTLDFIIIFVPSEMVYSMINVYLPDIIDQALKDKVVFTSPFAFYALIRTIDEANRSLRFEKDLKKIIGVIETLIKEYGKFQKEFGIFGQRLESLQKAYNQITQTRYNQLNKRFIEIQNYKSSSSKLPSPEKVKALKNGEESINS